MPNLTENLGLNTFLENEVVNFEDVNANFEKIDTMVMCVESGTKTASYSGGSESTVTWRYKKYSDNTIEMNAKLNFSSIKCDGGSAAPYYSGSATAYFPFTLTSIYDVQMHLASSVMGWVSNITGESVSDSVSFRVLSMTKESSAAYKQVFVTVKGVIA